MDGLSRIEPLLDAVRPERRERTGSLEDPVLESFLDHIDRYLEKLREQRKIQEEARLEDRRLQVEYDRKLSFLKGKVDEALHAMLAVRENAEPGVTTPEQRRYQYWKTELEHFKQRGRIAGV